ncbi:MAG: hypothetical protein ACT4P0_05715 [Panacagrimonas sp.]
MSSKVTGLGQPMEVVSSLGNDYACPHCGWAVELRADLEEECHQRVHHLTVHAFEDGYGCPIDVIGDIDVLRFSEGADSWASAAQRVREAILHLVAPATREQVGLCLELLRDEALGPDVADRARRPFDEDPSEDPEVMMLKWLDHRYPPIDRGVS